MNVRIFPVAVFAAVLVANTAIASEVWSCHIEHDTAPAGVAQTETIAVESSALRLSSDEGRDYSVDRNDDEKLVANFADYGGKPPIRTAITVVKASGRYTHVVTEANRMLRTATGHCTRR